MSHAAQPVEAAPERAGRQAALLALAVVLCYANSLRVPFLFDDPRPHTPLGFGTRPLVSASFALNRAISGADTWSYHLWNILVHLGCGLLLLPILRRTLAFAAPGLERGTRSGLALASTLLWLCHPLQTESVTYLSQRAETMAAFSYLAVLYAFLRSVSAARPLPWQALALLALALGFACKEIVATAPVMLLLYDALFLERCPLGALRRRAGFYATLFLGGLALCATLVVPMLVAEDMTVGFRMRSVEPAEYARTQPAVILHYLRLALWPHPLVLDYGWKVAQGPGDYLPQTIALLALLGATGWLLVRRSWIGFASAWFFLILAPTSSFIPIKDLAFEHRVYLPLAGVVPLVVVAGWWLCRRFLPAARFLPPTLALAATLALGTATVLRNRDYRSTLTLMQTVVAHAPENSRGHYNLGTKLLDLGRIEEGIAELETALRLSPRNDSACRNLAAAYLRRGDAGRALEYLARAVELEPEDAEVRIDVAALLVARGDPQAALEHCRRALEIPPDTAREQACLGRCLAALGRSEAALAALREACRLAPQEAEPHAAFAEVVCAAPGAGPEQRAEALRMAARANELSGSRHAAVLETYARALAATGDHARAIARLEEALALSEARTNPALSSRLRRRIEQYRSGAGD